MNGYEINLPSDSEDEQVIENTKTNTEDLKIFNMDGLVDEQNILKVSQPRLSKNTSRVHFSLSNNNEL